MSWNREGFDRAVARLKALKAEKVFLQYPEGIKLEIQNIAKELDREGFDVVVCTEPCFGACDIRDSEAERLGCDAVLHIGHSDYGVESGMPVVYWEYSIDSDPLPALEKDFNKLEKFEKIGLVTSIQFIDTLEKAGDYLKGRGKKVFIHGNLKHAGQILGCNLEAATGIEDDVDCFLCISAGKFYGLGLVLETEKPVFCLDLEKREINDLGELKKKIQKAIAWNRSKFEDAKQVGIIVSWKRGQLKETFEVKRKLEEKGKEAYIFAMDEITPEKLLGLKIDAAINLACPRIGIDDLEKYKVPLLNLKDVDL